MSDRIDRRRRRFIGFCASSAAMAAGLPELLAATGNSGQVQRYGRALLVDSDGGSPLDAATLEPGVNYIFHYPYASTPCFLLDLGRPVTRSVELRTRDDDAYVWQGGLGPNNSIVAFSAICSHRMTHPDPDASFISYHPAGRHEPEDRGVIHCCSEDSIYDPFNGAQVLSGPAPEPLAAIELVYDESAGTMTAVGATGGTQFDRFLDRFGHRLSINYGSRYDERVEDRTEVVPLDEFSRSHFEC